MLIEKYDLEVFTPPCDPGAERYAARARLTGDISEVLPYLNATLRGAIFHPGANALTWKKGGHNIAFHAYEIATSNVEDRDGAEKEIKALTDLVNRTWERRTEITPVTKPRRPPRPLDVHAILPQTNCKQCGEATCMAFAVNLLMGKTSLDHCLPLRDNPAYIERLTTLEAML